MATISYDNFEKIINNYKEMDTKEKEATEILGLTEGFIWDMMGFCYDMLLYSIYGENVPEYDDVSYFIYELNFGEKYEDGCYTIDGENRKLETVKDLYDCLVEDGYITIPEFKESKFDF